MTEQALPIYYAERCTGCGLCVAVCPHGVLSMVAEQAAFSMPENCVYCGECELACPTEAVELYYEIVDVVQADAATSSGTKEE
ncbi:MAG: 4Fe-4S binding protein [Anaerolineae bacterium]